VTEVKRVVIAVPRLDRRSGRHGFVEPHDDQRQLEFPPNDN
jgi:hypothetical protein